VDFVVKFAIINGTRYKTYSEWVFPCGDALLDNDFDMEFEETEDGECWSALLNEQREALLIYREG